MLWTLVAQCSNRLLELIWELLVYLSDMFLYSYEAESVQKLLSNKYKYCCRKRQQRGNALLRKQTYTVSLNIS